MHGYAPCPSEGHLFSYSLQGCSFHEAQEVGLELQQRPERHQFGDHHILSAGLCQFPGGLESLDVRIFFFRSTSLEDFVWGIPLVCNWRNSVTGEHCELVCGRKRVHTSPKLHLKGGVTLVFCHIDTDECHWRRG